MNSAADLGSASEEGNIHTENIVSQHPVARS
jgi:hypothetical protein